jgi:hypothetical protein
MYLTNCTVLYFINKQPTSYEVTKMTMTIMMVGDDDITIIVTSNLSISTASYCRMLVIVVVVLEVVKRERVILVVDCVSSPSL